MNLSMVPPLILETSPALLFPIHLVHSWIAQAPGVVRAD